MTDYIIDVIIDHILENDCSSHTGTKLYIKIDKNGNVDIKKQNIHYQQGIHNQYSRIWDELVINDNIPIPTYMIDMLKKLFSLPTSSRFRLHLNHYENVIASIKILKEDIARGHNNNLIDYL